MNFSANPVDWDPTEVKSFKAEAMGCLTLISCVCMQRAKVSGRTEAANQIQGAENGMRTGCHHLPGQAVYGNLGWTGRAVVRTFLGKHDMDTNWAGVKLTVLYYLP